MCSILLKVSDCLQVVIIGAIKQRSERPAIAQDVTQTERIF